MVKTLNVVAWILTVLVTLGAVNWGIVGVNIFRNRFVDLGAWDLFASWMPWWLAGATFVLVGVAGILLIPSVLAMIFGKRR